MALICGHKMYNAMSRQSSLCFVGKLFFVYKTLNRPPTESFGHIFSKSVQATPFKITGNITYNILCAMLYIIKHGILLKEWHEALK